MRTKAEERVELHVPAGQRARWRRAAQLAGVPLSDWARLRLDQHASEELGVEEPLAPSKRDIAEALESVAILRRFSVRAAVRRAMNVPWTVSKLRRARGARVR
jgi:hypothetical protein